MTVNKVILLGRLGKDPEGKSTNNGTNLCNFSLATTERRKAADGTWGEHTEWHSLVAWGKTADFLVQYCQKGRQLYVEGRLQTREWADKNGEKRYKTEIVAETVYATGPKSETQGATQSNNRAKSQTQADDWAPSNGASEDDVPF